MDLKENNQDQADVQFVRSLIEQNFFSTVTPVYIVCNVAFLFFRILGVCGISAFQISQVQKVKNMIKLCNFFQFLVHNMDFSAGFLHSALRATFIYVKILLLQKSQFLG